MKAHNGTVNGHAYFKCAEKHGLLVPLERVTLLAHGEVGASCPPDAFGSGSSEPSENLAAVGIGPAPGDDGLTGFELPDATDDDEDGYFGTVILRMTEC